MSRRFAKQRHRISMGYAGFHETAASPRDMKRDMERAASPLRNADDRVAVTTTAGARLPNDVYYRDAQ
jgi:cytidylate kinase